MKLLPVVLIPNINQKILKKPFYKYVVDDALKVNKDLFIITNKKKINFNFKNNEIKKFYINNLNKKNVEKILKKI